MTIGELSFYILAIPYFIWSYYSIKSILGSREHRVFATFSSWMWTWLTFVGLVVFIITFKDYKLW